MQKVKIDFQLSFYGEVKQIDDVDTAKLEQISEAVKSLVNDGLIIMGVKIDLGIGSVTASRDVEVDSNDDDALLEGDLNIAAYIKRVMLTAADEDRCRCDRCEFVRHLSEHHDMDEFVKWLLTPRAQREGMAEPSALQALATTEEAEATAHLN